MKTQRRSTRKCLCSFFNLVARGDGWLSPALGRFTFGKQTLCPMYGRLGGPPLPVWMGAENLAPKGIRSRTVLPLTSCYTDCTIQEFSEPGPRHKLGTSYERWNLKGTYALNNCVWTYKALLLASRSLCHCFLRVWFVSKKAVWEAQLYSIDYYYLRLIYINVVCVWNVMAHAQKPYFVFRRNGRVHLNWRGSQFSRLLAVEECGSADSDCIDRVTAYSARLLATHSILIFPLHFPSRASPCAIRFRTRYNTKLGYHDSKEPKNVVVVRLF